MPTGRRALSLFACLALLLAGIGPLLGAQPAPPRPLPGASGPANYAGTITSNTGALGNVACPITGNAAVVCQITGTWSATLIFEATLDNVNWVTARANAVSSDTLVTAPAANGIYMLASSGLTAVRLRASAFVSGPVVVTFGTAPGSSVTLPVSAVGGGGGGGAVTIADGASVTQGALADAAVGDATGTVNGHLRQIAKSLAGTVTTQGAGADNAALSGNPVRIGVSDATNIQTLRQAAATTATTGAGLLGAAPQGLAVALGSNPAAAAAGQYANQVQTRGGIPFVLGGHPNIITVRANYTTAQTNTVLVANSAGTKIVVTGIEVAASNANSVNVSVIVGMGQTTTPTTTGVFCSHPGVAPGSGINRGDGSGVLAEGADGDQVFITSGVATGGSIDCVISYFTTSS